MKVLDERKTKKIKHRKELNLKTIIHESTIDKVVEEEDLKHLDIILNGKRPDLLWGAIFEDIPTVKVDGRFKIGEYRVFENKKFFLKIRNPNRFKTQIVELCFDQSHI
jgi:hypothetical protein